MFFCIEKKELQALTFGTYTEYPVFDPLTVLHLDNWLYRWSYNNSLNYFADISILFGQIDYDAKSLMF